MEQLWSLAQTSLTMEFNVSQAYNISQDGNETVAMDRVMMLWPEYKAAEFMIRYVLIAVIIMGTIGNLLSVLVLVRRRMRNNSINFYLTLLSAADTVVLYLSGFKTWLRVVTGLELLHTSNASCKIIIFLFMFSSHVSAWLIVLVTADRFIAVWFPFKAAVYCSIRRARITGIVMVVIMAAFNAHLLWTNNLFEYRPGIHQCAPLPANAFMKGAFICIRLAFYTIIPFIIVLSMNIAIIVCICIHSKKSLSDTNSMTYYRPASKSRLSKGNSNSDNRVYQSVHEVAIMLLVVSFAWLVLTMPYAIISLISFTYPTNQSRAVTFLLKTISFVLMYLNHSINFFLYCIAGKKFRVEFFKMFHEIKQWKRTSMSLNDRTFRSTRSRRPPTPAPAPPGQRIFLDPSLDRLRVM